MDDTKGGVACIGHVFVVFVSLVVNFAFMLVYPM